MFMLHEDPNIYNLFLRISLFCVLIQIYTFQLFEALHHPSYVTKHRVLHSRDILYFPHISTPP